jgi:hypothetical protein
MLAVRVFDYALDAEFKARVRAANDFFNVSISTGGKYNVFECTKIYAAGGRYMPDR